MTRVLMTADAVGGVWTYALELADALAPQHVEVVVAVTGPPMSPAQRDEIARSAVTDVHEIGGPLEWMDDPWDDLDRAGTALLALEADVRPDVVHLNEYARAVLPWRAPTVVVGHSCVFSWWEAVHHQAPPPSWAEYRRRVRAGLEAAGRVVAPTRAMLDALRRGYGLADGVVVPNCRRSPTVGSAAKEPLVLAAGRVWDEAKNVAALERVAHRLDAPVRIAGAGESGPGRLGVLGSDELAGWMARASVFAHPARYEPFGLAPLEAARAGCALVLGDIPSLREVWAGAAIYVDPDDDDGLVAAISGLLRDAELRSQMASRAEARSRTYEPERTALGYLDVYGRLTAGVGSTR